MYSLDVESYRIEAVATTGSPPGWIYGHSAAHEVERGTIIVRSGSVLPEPQSQPRRNTAVHRLDLATLCWERVAETEAHREFVLRHGPNRWTDAPADAYRPRSTPHEWIELAPASDPVYQIMVDAVRVTFGATGVGVTARVEGTLPVGKAEQLIAEIAEQLSETTGCHWWVTETTK